MTDADQITRIAADIARLQEQVKSMRESRTERDRAIDQKLRAMTIELEKVRDTSDHLDDCLDDFKVKVGAEINAIREEVGRVAGSLTIFYDPVRWVRNNWKLILVIAVVVPVWPSGWVVVIDHAAKLLLGK